MRKEMNAVLSVMVEDKIGPGEQAKLLVQTARERIKFEHCLALRSPAIALQISMRSLGLKEGDAVIISALSPLYYLRVIEDMGLIPIYADVQAAEGGVVQSTSIHSSIEERHVQAASSCMSRETVEKALAGSIKELNVRCIVMHHTLGYIGNSAAIAELGIPVIEDCSRSYGTVLEEKSLNEAAFTILGLEERDMLTSGGGALLYSQNRRSSRGAGNQNLPVDMPPEYGLADMNAALAVIQFRETEKNLAKRREIAELYTQAVLRTRHKRFVQQGEDYNNYAFPLILESGVKDVKVYARRKDIEVESAFDDTPVASGMVSPGQCPEAYSLSLRTVLFPIYPRLRMTDAAKVAKIIQTIP
jgi:dTDP-4-amino-4,6-dideoxygalactose transaminase